MTSGSLDRCLSETVGSSVGSAPEPVDIDQDRVVELLSHSYRKGFIPRPSAPPAVSLTWTDFSTHHVVAQRRTLTKLRT